MADAVVAFTETTHTVVKKIKFAWTSATAGTASGTTTSAYDGKVEQLVTVPGTAGDAPADNYDLTVTDADGLDVLIGAGADRDTANTELVAGTSLGAVAGSRLTFSIANAGDANKGTAYLIIR